MHHHLGKILGEDFEYEKEVVWTRGGIEIIGHMDAVHKGSGAIIEFKTTTSTRPTGFTSSNTPLSTLEQDKAQNLRDILYSYSFGRCPLYIHKLQLRVSIDPRYYNDIQKNCSKHNREKQHEERIGTAAVVKYSVYPNGTIMVYVGCSNNPFKLEDEISLYSFLVRLVIDYCI